MSRSILLTVGSFAVASWMLLNWRYLRVMVLEPAAFEAAEDALQILKLQLQNEKNKTAEALAANKELIQRLNATTGDTGQETVSTNNDDNEICSALFPHQLIPASMDVWRRRLPTIFNHSRHFMDPRYFFHDLTLEMLHVITPERLQRSVRNLPHDLEVVERVLRKAFTRYKYLQSDTTQEAQDEPPKVQVLVMGGSVAVGDQCRYREFPGQMSRRQCAWPQRTFSFLNSILGGEVFELVDAAIGGTNTESGITLLEYELLPTDQPPDVVIHGYATNDMHLYTMQAAEHQNQTLRGAVTSLTERFIRTVLTTPCQDDDLPLLIHFDDYLGNQQRDILDTNIVSQSVSTLANYYGIMSVSYPNVVRDFVYGDTHESWFSPARWYNNRNGGNMETEVHPTIGAHIAASWVLAFNAMNLVTHYCSSEYAKTKLVEPLESLPPLKGGQEYNLVKPNPIPRGLPPMLSDGLTLDEVSHKWRSVPVKNETCMPGQRRCIAAWASHLSVTTEQQLNETLEPFLVQNNGWKPVLDYRKIGFVPTGGLHSSFTLEFNNITRPVRTVTWMVMKSYGERWSQSVVRMQALARNDGEETWSDLGLEFELEGFHDKNTSESYSHTIDIDAREVGSDLRLVMELVGGTVNSTFKIMGMAVCS